MVGDNLLVVPDFKPSAVNGIRLLPELSGYPVHKLMGRDYQEIRLELLNLVHAVQRLLQSADAVHHFDGFSGKLVAIFVEPNDVDSLGYLYYLRISEVGDVVYGRQLTDMHIPLEYGGLVGAVGIVVFMIAGLYKQPLYV